MPASRGSEDEDNEDDDDDFVENRVEVADAADEGEMSSGRNEVTSPSCWKRSNKASEVSVAGIWNCGCASLTPETEPMCCHSRWSFSTAQRCLNASEFNSSCTNN